MDKLLTLQRIPKNFAECNVSWLFTQHFGWRGRQGQHELKIDDFLFLKDDDEAELIYFVERPAKTRGHGLDAKHRTTIPKMFSTGDAGRYPVLLLRTYIAHRPSQLSNTGPFYLSVNEKPATTVWYESIPLGKNSMANIMTKMKLASPLSTRCPEKRITNHSARKQVVTKLKSAGIPKCDIKNIAGHSTEKRLDDYDSGDEKEQLLL